MGGPRAGNDWTARVETAGSVVYAAGGRNDGDGYVNSYADDGRRHWRRRLAGTATSLTAALDDGLAVGVAGDRPGVHRVGSAGEPRWFFETATDVRDLVGGGSASVYALTVDGTVLALSDAVG